MAHLPSYPKVWAIGHPSADGIFDGTVVVQEKLDGSQFSAGVIGGELCMKSKGGSLVPGAVQKLFAPAAATMERLFAEGKLPEGVIYRGEAICRPKHNAITYGRAPEAGLVLFDIDVGPERRLQPTDVAMHAEALGLEVVPTLYIGTVSSAEQLRAFLDRDSFLGGSKVEGVVVKNYARFGADGKQLMAKLVSEAFKERQRVDWKQSNPSQGDVVLALGRSLATEARWRKLVQHAEEAGKLAHEPKDIGLLYGALAEEIETEDKPELLAELWKAFGPEIRRRAGHGLAEFYRNLLAGRAFAPAANDKE